MESSWTSTTTFVDASQMHLRQLFVATTRKDICWSMPFVMYPVHMFEFVSTPAADAVQYCAPGATSSSDFSSTGSCAAWHTGQGSHVVVTSWRPFESVSHAADVDTRTFVVGRAYMRSCLSDTATPIAGGAMCTFETTLSNWQSTSGMCSLSSPRSLVTRSGPLAPGARVSDTAF